MSPGQTRRAIYRNVDYLVAKLHVHVVGWFTTLKFDS